MPSDDLVRHVAQEMRRPDMTCQPPPGTEPGTLHVLRRDNQIVLAMWGGDCWKTHRLSETRGEPAPLGVEYVTRGGWRYAGLAPELPSVPQTAAEIAREALDAHYTMENAALIPTPVERRLADALRRIAEMEP